MCDLKLEGTKLRPVLDTHYGLPCASFLPNTAFGISLSEKLPLKFTSINILPEAAIGNFSYINYCIPLYVEVKNLILIRLT